MKAHFNGLSNENIKTTKSSFYLNKRNFLRENNQNKTYISSSIPKTNKTLKKYINEKLNSMKKIKNNPRKSLIKNNDTKSNQKNKINIIYKKTSLSSNFVKFQKPKERNQKQKNIKENIYNKNIISKNSNLNQNYKTCNNFNKNSSFNIITKRKEDRKKSNIIISTSTTGGLSISSDKISNSTKFDFDKNNSNNESHYIHKNIINNNTNDIINRNDKRYFLEDRGYCKHKINNFNYETGSDDNPNDNIIFLKCDNYSSLTFGNSFSYSNSQRKNKNNNDENININNKNLTCFVNTNNTKNNNDVNKLKEENEALKKELQESNDQINLLRNQIKELKGNIKYNFRNSSRNITGALNLRDKQSFHNNLTLNINSNNINNKELLFNGVKGKMKFKKDVFENINNIIIINNIYKNRKKIMNAKNNFNYVKKNYKKNQEEYYSLVKTCEQINE